MISKIKKPVSILLSLIMVFSLFTIVPLSASAAENAFVKVTSEPTDWSGEYLVVYEVNNEPNKVFNSAANLASGANILQAEFGVSDGNIDYDDTTAAAVVTIAKIGDTGYYSIKTASGNYIGRSNDSNGIDESGSTLDNTIAWDNGSVKITSAGGAIMRYNTGSSQFRYYKSSTYTNQQPIQLYKLTAAEPEPDPAPTGYFIVGSFNDWSADEAYLMTANAEAENEYMYTGLALNEGDEFKVIYQAANGDWTWYPDQGGNYVVPADGNYDIYFRPNYDGGEDWHYGCIYAAYIEPEPTLLEIIEQPFDWVGNYGEQISFTVTAQGDGLSYQWYYRSAGKTTWNECANTDSCYEGVTLNTKRVNREMYCEITDQYGNTVDTEIVTIKLYDAPEDYKPVKIVTQPVDWEGADGEYVNLQVVAEGEGLTYAWYYRNGGHGKWNLTSDTDSCYDSVMMSAKRDGREMYCLITDAYGATVKTNVVTISAVK